MGAVAQRGCFEIDCDSVLRDHKLATLRKIASSDLVPTMIIACLKVHPKSLCLLPGLHYKSPP